METTDKNKQRPPIASIEPIEKENFFHFMPGAKAYFLEAVDQDLTCSNCRGKTGQSTPAARTPAEVINDAQTAQAGIISSTCTDTSVSCDYSFNLIKLAKQNGFATTFDYFGCLNPGNLKKLLPYLDAVMIDTGEAGNSFCQNISQAPIAALSNIKIVASAGKHLEVFYLLSTSSILDDTQLNTFLKGVQDNSGLDTPIHFATAADTGDAQALANINHARDLAKDSGFKYVYLSGISSADGQDTFCADGSIGLKRQDNFLLQDNLIGGKCADGTVIPGIWK